MKDKLTKKRVKVDYPLVIAFYGLSDEFLQWQQSKNRLISFRRSCYAFCKSKKVDVESAVLVLKQFGVKSLDELQKEQIRLAKLKWLED